MLTDKVRGFYNSHDKLKMIIEQVNNQLTKTKKTNDEQSLQL